MNTKHIFDITALQQQAKNDLKKAALFNKYGLHVQSQFPLPDHRNQNTSIVLYHSAHGKLFQNCSAAEKKLLAENIQLSYKSNLPAQGFWAHSLIEDGLLLVLPQGSDPYIVELEAQGDLAVAYVLIIARENSVNSVVIQHRNNAPSHTIINVVCEPNSNLQLVLCEPQTYIPHYSQISSTIGNQATFNCLQLARNINMLQAYIATTAGEETHIEQNHLVFGSRDNKHDLYSEIKHLGAHSQSRLQSKIILRDQAHTIYRGMSYIEPSATGCSSQQKEQTLLLNTGAKIDVVPMLAITNDNIQCTHSASVSSLDSEQLFYLQSRGFSYEEAESFIVQGFYSDILKQFSNLALCSLIHDYISSELREQNSEIRNKTMKHWLL